MCESSDMQAGGRRTLGPVRAGRLSPGELRGQIAASIAAGGKPDGQLRAGVISPEEFGELLAADCAGAAPAGGYRLVSGVGLVWYAEGPPPALANGRASEWLMRDLLSGMRTRYDWIGLETSLHQFNGIFGPSL